MASGGMLVVEGKFLVLVLSVNCIASKTTADCCGVMVQ